MPLTPNGKVDRKVLPAPGKTRSEADQISKEELLALLAEKKRLKVAKQSKDVQDE